MSELIGLSVDQTASPHLSFEDVRLDGPEGGGRSADDQRNGWGVAWYPSGELGAAVVRDPHSGRTGGVTDVLADYGMLETSLLVSHLRGAAKRANYRDTHPFVTSFAGRSWVMAHNGDLVGDLRRALPLPDGPTLQPIGPTDTEHLFVWLLGRMADSGASSIEEFGFERLAEVLIEANELGTLNVVLADGASLFVYHCSSGFQPLYRGRFVPPYPTSGDDTSVLDVHKAGVSLGLSGHRDRTRSLVVLSSLQFDDSFEPLEPGGFAVAAGGHLVAPVEPTGVAAGALRVPSPVTLAPRSTSRHLEIAHKTRYRYSTPVDRSSHRLRLNPVHDRFQQVLRHSVEVGVEGLQYDYEDVFGNLVIGAEIDSPYTELIVSMTASLRLHAPVDRPQLLPRPLKLPVMWMPWQEHMMHSYLLPPELLESQLDELTEYARSFSTRNRNELMGTLDDIAWTIYSDYTYKQGHTTLETTPYEVFRTRAGVCQDFANLMICLARMLNIPARYRVGYIFTGADYDNTLQSDASHAWVEVYIPLVGWRGYDPTNGSRVGADHVRVAAGRNYRDATPTSGVIYLGGGDESMTIDVQVTDVST